MPDDEVKVEEVASDEEATASDQDDERTDDARADDDDAEASGRSDEGSDGGDEEAAAGDPVEEAEENVEVSLEDVLTTATNERDEFRDHLLRLQADFDNYRKRVHKELGEAGDKALGHFVEELLPVLDAIDAAKAHGGADSDPVSSLLVDLLAKQGLERVGSDGDVFDPTLHDAVMHEAGDDDVQTVAQVLRAGWRWRGRVLRPAMVKVIGG